MSRYALVLVADDGTVSAIGPFRSDAAATRWALLSDVTNEISWSVHILETPTKVDAE